MDLAAAIGGKLWRDKLLIDISFMLSACGTRVEALQQVQGRCEVRGGVK